MPSVQPLGADRAPARERELGVSGGDETDVPVGQQSTTPVARDKPVRAQRRRLPGHDCRSARKLELDEAEATAWDQLLTVALYRELQLIAEGNLLAAHLRVHGFGRELIQQIQIERFEQARIVEHWRATGDES